MDDALPLCATATHAHQRCRGFSGSRVQRAEHVFQYFSEIDVAALVCQLHRVGSRVSSTQHQRAGVWGWHRREGEARRRWESLSWGAVGQVQHLTRTARKRNRTWSGWVRCQPMGAAALHFCIHQLQFLQHAVNASLWDLDACGGADAVRSAWGPYLGTLSPGTPHPLPHSPTCFFLSLVLRRTICR